MFRPKYVLEDGHRYAPTVQREYFNLESRQILGKNYKGLFTKEFIKEGSIIAIDGGIVLTSCKDFPKELKYTVLIENGLFLSPVDFSRLDNLSYFNHSCNANVSRIGGLVFVAKNDIYADNELTLDYAPLISGIPNWEMNCDCGVGRCRKIITGDDWKDPKIAKSLWQQWLPHIQKKIVEEKIL